MGSEKVNSNLQMLFSKMEEFISTKTVVGEAVHIGDVIIIPLVDVSFGVGAGVNEATDDAKKGKDLGGGALGAKLSPSAVVVISKGTVQMVNVKNQDSVNKFIDMIPGFFSKFDWGSIFSKKDKNKPETQDFDESRITEEL